MPMLNWLLLVGVLVALVVIVGVAAAVLAASIGPDPENRPAPPERMADLKQARDDALRKIAARQRRSL